MVEFVNPNTMNNARGEAAVVNRLQELGFVVNKPSVKNQPFMIYLYTKAIASRARHTYRLKHVVKIIQLVTELAVRKAYKGLLIG